jgi:DNA-binding transcriptional ArsR family regulator
MGVTKTLGFSDEINDLAIVFKALGHPARLTIITYLVEKKECVCGDIVNELPLAQATISQHLRELKTAGIIQGTVEGTSVCYCLNINLLKQIESILKQWAIDLAAEDLKCC